jgi:thymidylate synthase
MDPDPSKIKQKIVVFQQTGSGEGKIAGIRKFGKNRFVLEVVSIDAPLPPVIDDGDDFLPETISADLVLDFLRHPDLSQDLSERCRKAGIPVVASGKKLKVKGTLTPPT